jgi:hypothetical protein
VKLGLEADRTIVDCGGDKQVGYLHVTDTARIQVSEALVPNDAKSLMGQAADLLIDNRRWWWVDSSGSTLAAGGTAGTRRWRPGKLGGKDNGCSRSNDGFRQRRGRRDRVDGGFWVASFYAVEAVVPDY